jgi:hypothetical protein
VLLGGCQGLTDAVTPGRAGKVDAARVAFSAVLPTTSRSTVVTLDLVGTYARRDGSQVRFMDRTLSLTNAAEQAVPVSVDLASCLGDAARSSGPDGLGCRVTLALGLVVDGTTVDRQVIGPLLLKPGGTAEVAEPVSLFEIASMEVRDAAGAVLDERTSLAAEVGSGLSLRATLRDRAGAAVAGRAIAWSSDAAGVATVDATGQVSAVSAGVARITASHGDVARSVLLRVRKLPLEVVVRAGAGAGAGRVISVPAGLDCLVNGAERSGVCSARFPADSLVRLAATPSAASRFGTWGDACAGTETSCQLQVTEMRQVTVGFLALRRVDVRATGDGRGQVVGPGIECTVEGDVARGQCTTSLVEGERMVLQALPAPASASDAEAVFDLWGGACLGAATAGCTVVLGSSDVLVTAGFRAPREVVVALEGDGAGRVEGGSVRCEGTEGVTTGACRGSVRYGSTVVLQAVAQSPSRFSGWSGDCSSAGQAPTCEVEARRAVSVRARFSAGRELIVESARADGEGRVVGPGGLDCLVRGVAVSGTCRVVLAADTATVSASAAKTPRRQTFGGWDGPCGLASACGVRLEGTRTVVRARFHDEQQLAVNAMGTGAGQVTATSVSLACAVARGGLVSGTCIASEPWGTLVTLTAVADPNSSFAGWSGECVSVQGNSCRALLTAARRVTATFVPRRVSLTITARGTGAGLVTVDGQPACQLTPGATSATCVQQLDAGAVVTIGATPASSSLNGGLTGDCVATTSCQLRMDDPRAVEVRLDLREYTFTVAPAGAGGGRVSVNGAAFCSSIQGTPAVPCTMRVTTGTTLQVAFAPATGSALAGVSGGCAQGDNCTIVVAGDVTVVPRFEPAVRVEFVPLGSGTGVMAAPGFLCSIARGVVSGSCVGYVLAGTSLTVNAQPDRNSRVDGWLFPCPSAPGPTCTVVVKEPLRISARLTSLD